MISLLTRERVINEVTTLAREIDIFITSVEPQRGDLPLDLQEYLDELERAIVCAKQLINSNTMDFREVELGLKDVRAVKAYIYSSLNELKTNA